MRWVRLRLGCACSDDGSVSLLTRVCPLGFGLAGKVVTLSRQIGQEPAHRLAIAHLVLKRASGQSRASVWGSGEGRLTPRGARGRTITCRCWPGAQRLPRNVASGRRGPGMSKIRGKVMLHPNLCYHATYKKGCLWKREGFSRLTSETEVPNSFLELKQPRLLHIPTHRPARPAAQAGILDNRRL